MQNKVMYFDPHIHMVSRTTDDYEAMARAGIVGVIEPAFWLGQARTEVGSFKDYYNSLIGWERFRASQFGIKHYCSMGLNSKEANNEELAERVMELLPRYIYKEGVVAIGEIGYDDQSALEEKYFSLQVALGKQAKLPIQIHTPHRDKKKGTSRSMDLCEDHGVDPSMVIVDHNNEETVEEVLERGYWAAFTIYPHTKMGSERMVAVVQRYGPERIFINSAADWGISDPLAVPKTAQLMRERGIPETHIHRVSYRNAIDAFSSSGQIQEEDWLQPQLIDQREKYNGNSVLRGGQQALVSTKDSTVIT